MALIGSLVINFRADTSDFTSKTKEAQKAVVAFEGGVLGSIRNSVRQMKAGFADISTGLGLLKRTFNNIGIVKALRQQITSGSSKLFSPLVEGFQLIGGKLVKLASPLIGRVGKVFASLNDKVAGGIGFALKYVTDRVGTAFKLISSGVGAVAGGFVKLGTSLASGVLQGAFAIFKGITSLLTGLVSAAGQLVGVLGGVAGELVKVGAGLVAVGVAAAVYSAKEAAHLIESINLQKQTFGEYASYVVRQSQEMSKAFGTNRQEFLRGAAAFGSILQGVGFGAKQSATLASNFARLAADLSASRDLPLEESIQKLQSALSGEFEPLKALGVLLNEDRIKAYAYANGIARIGSELTQTQKAQSTIALVTKGLAQDQGALSRESTGAAAQISEVWGRIQGLVEDVGMSLAPILAGALRAINNGIVVMGQQWEANKNRVLAWFGLTTEALAQGIDGTDYLAAGLGWLAEGWVKLKGTTLDYFASSLSGMATLLKSVATFFSALGDAGLGTWAKDVQFKLEDVSKSLNKSADSWKKSAQDTFANAGQGQKAVQEAFARGKDVRDAAQAALSDPLKFDVGTPENPLKNTPKKLAGKPAFAEAQRFGSKEAAQTILRAKFGNPKKDETVRNTAETAKNTAAGTTAIVDLGKKFENWANKQVNALVGFDG